MFQYCGKKCFYCGDTFYSYLYIPQTKFPLFYAIQKSQFSIKFIIAEFEDQSEIRKKSLTIKVANLNLFQIQKMCDILSIR